ncbi:MAG: c-type cytochrome biogenesis protein CcmI [Rhodobacteraceae bacterium]|nr:c-type cytochrome biogenesis protein CcmI [Paracoccaceae bacterium]
MLFWILAAALAAAIAVLMILALWRGDDGANVPGNTQDLGVYRDQLKGVEADLARGVIAPDEAERLRLEISRRVLEADRVARGSDVAGRAPRSASVTAAVALMALLAAAFGLYARIGAPGYPDVPLQGRLADAEAAYDARPSQAEAEAQAAARRGTPPAPDAQVVALMERLRAAVAERPDDPLGHELLARNEAILGDYHAAWTTQEKLIALKGDAATVADHVMLAEWMIGATGGIITPEIESLLGDIVANDPGNGTALFYLGMMMAQLDRPDRTFAIWSSLLARGPESAPWIAPIRRSINDLAWLAGAGNYVAPAPVLPGPSEADIAAAAALAPQAREAALRAPVEALMAQMAELGGTADEWGRLISALAVLDETERAAAIWAEAQRVFADLPDELARVSDAAARAGLPGGVAAPRGPTAGDIANAAALSADEQAAFIEGMVARLGDRLAAEGGSAAEWAQLLRALGTLGRTDEARARWAEAQAAFAGRPDDLATIRAAAATAGVAE